MPNPSIAFSFDSEVVDDYTCGDCWLLAAAVKDVTGLPFVAYFDKADGQWNHVANRLPDGRIVDIEGVWTPEAWAEKWDRWFLKAETTLPAVTDWTPADYDTWVVGAVFPYTAPEKANSYAEAIKALIPA